MDQSANSLLSKIVKIIDGNTTVVNIPPRNADQSANDNRSHGTGTGLWSLAEHERFLQGVVLHPNGPWNRVAAFVGTRTAKQTRAHAQKYVQKIGRHLRGLLRGQSALKPTKSNCSSDANPAERVINVDPTFEDIDWNEVAMLLARQSGSDRDDLVPEDVEGADGIWSGKSACGSNKLEPMAVGEDEEWVPDQELLDILRGINE